MHAWLRKYHADERRKAANKALLDGLLAELKTSDERHDAYLVLAAYLSTRVSRRSMQEACQAARDLAARRAP